MSRSGDDSHEIAEFDDLVALALAEAAGAGDFLHADGNTDHGELWTDEGAKVILVVAADEELPDPATKG